MKSREFNAAIKAITVDRGPQKGQLSKAKLGALPADQKDALAMFVVRNRGPLLADLVSPSLDRSWLAKMGYLYTTASARTGLTFIHTGEHQIH